MPAGVAHAIVKRQPSGVTTLTLIQDSLRRLGRADRSLSVDCGMAKLCRGSPELWLVQLDPLDEKKLARAVIVRYERERFIQQAEKNERFRVDIEAILEKASHRGEPGELSKLATKAETANASGAIAAIIDTEIELITRLGEKGRIVFLGVAAADLHWIVTQTESQLPFRAELEVALSLRSLADLLLSWRTLAQELGGDPT